MFSILKFFLKFYKFLSRTLNFVLNFKTFELFNVIAFENNKRSIYEARGLLVFI